MQGLALPREVDARGSRTRDAHAPCQRALADRRGWRAKYFRPPRGTTRAHQTRRADCPSHPWERQRNDQTRVAEQERGLRVISPASATICGAVLSFQPQIKTITSRRTIQTSNRTIAYSRLGHGFTTTDSRAPFALWHASIKIPRLNAKRPFRPRKLIHAHPFATPAFRHQRCGTPVRPLARSRRLLPLGRR